MGRLTIAALIAAAAAAAGATGAGAVALLSDEGDREIPSIVIPADRTASVGTQQALGERLVVDDGVPGDAARTLARAAASHIGGRALDLDLVEAVVGVHAQRPDGAIVEVVLDNRRIVMVDRGDCDG
jgi:hypothetical protein